VCCFEKTISKGEKTLKKSKKAPENEFSQLFFRDKGVKSCYNGIANEASCGCLAVVNGSHRGARGCYGKSSFVIDITEKRSIFT
jgi:hypothetical protein